MSLKRWEWKTTNKDACEALAGETGIDPFLARLLVARGMTDAQSVQAFLYGETLTDDPFAFADMDAAVDRITQAIERRERVLVFGDYDADGITAAVLLYSYLRYREADVSYRIPTRDREGYGLHTEIIEQSAVEGFQLIITVDNGIASVEEVALAKTLGMDVVITDHHMPQAVLPQAVAVVDPHRADCESEFKDYAGVGVAFMLVCALEGDSDWALEQYADLVALGTLADIMTLKGENRVLVRAGLKKINQHPRCGIRALLAAAGAEGRVQTASTVVFTLAPRINAAGRMGYPRKAAELLLCTDEAEAARLANEVAEYNTERQQIETQIFQEVLQEIERHPDYLYQRVIVVSGQHWHGGVVGILAARVLERFGKPCIVLSVSEDGYARGSGRSIPGFSLFDAIASCSDILATYGGHELAAGVGLSADRIDEFRERINRFAADRCPQMPTPVLSLDCKLAPSSVKPEILDILQSLEPFGTGNAVPVFGLCQMSVDEIVPVGNGKHLRLILRRDNTRLSAMWFQMTEEQCPFIVGDMVHVACTLDRNEFRNTVSVTVVVRDMVFASVDTEVLIRSEAALHSLLRGECPQAVTAEQLKPTRDDVAIVYRFLRKKERYCGRLDGLFVRIGDAKLTPLLLQMALEILREAGLCTCSVQSGRVEVSLLPWEGKADLQATQLWRALERL